MRKFWIESEYRYERASYEIQEGTNRIEMRIEKRCYKAPLNLSLLYLGTLST